MNTQRPHIGGFHHGEHHAYSAKLHKILNAAADFSRKRAVLLIATIAAVFSCVLVKPDKEYLGYFDFKTLSCLFCVLAVVMALRSIGFFTYAARKILSVAHTSSGAVLCLVYVTFIGSMLIANDMALITFLPL